MCLSKREGELAKDTTGKSTLYYVCQAGAWKNISDVDYELKLCNENRLGEVKSTAAKVGYVCRDNAWEKASAEDMELGFGCIESKRNKVFKSSAGNYFICKDGTWNASNAIISALGECTTEKAEALEKGVVDKAYYLCEKEGWTEVSKAVYDNGYCTEDRLNEYAAGFVCGTDDWREATTAEMTTEKVCVESIVNNVLNGYVCESEGWRDATAAEVATEKVCNASNDSTFVNGYACVKGAWREETAGEKANGDKFCNNDLDGFVSNGYACVDNAWRVANEAENSTKKVCDENIYKTVSDGYACKKNDSEYQWIVASEYEIAADSVCENTYLNVVKNKYMCENGQWRDAIAAERATGYMCTSASQDTVLVGYACSKSETTYAWREASALENVAKAVCRTSIANQWRGDILSTATTVICQENGSWRNATEGEVATKKICDSDTRDTVLNGYSCYYNSMKDSYLWRAATEMEKIANANCRSAIAGQLRGDRLSTSTTVICAKQDNGAYGWRYVSEGERSTGLICNANLQTHYMLNADSTMYYCGNYESGFAWKKVNPGDEIYSQDDRDGRTYTYVYVGYRFWSKTNLKYESQSSSVTDNAKCGRYYHKSDVACPATTTLPTEGDFIKLQKFATLSELKSTSATWNVPGTDKYGFSLEPCGYFMTYSETDEVGTNAVFWYNRYVKPSWYLSEMGLVKSIVPRTNERLNVRCIYNNNVSYTF